MSKKLRPDDLTKLSKRQREDRYRLKILTELWLKHLSYAQRLRVCDAAFTIARDRR